MSHSRAYNLTISHVARKLGVHRTTILRQAVRYSLGVVINPRMRLLSDVDMAFLRKIQRQPGVSRK